MEIDKLKYKFKRKIYKKMLEWKETKQGERALLIKGARRIGKSTIAEIFARNEYESYIAINFDKAPKAVWEAIENIQDIDDFLLRLQFIYKTTLTPRKSVIIFDEIQKAPLVRQAIKFLVEDGRFDYIETGSLLSIKKNTKDITIPSEETRLTMYPLDYEEFRWALGDMVSLPMIRKYFADKKPLGQELNRKLMRDFRLYMLVGGMPQAIETYLETNNLQEVDATKREILELYFDDFRKIDPSGRVTELFKAIPSQLDNEAACYKITSVIGRVSDDKSIAADMADSLCVNLAYHVTDPSVGMGLHKDMDCFKMYCSDTGLFITLAFMDKDVTENIVYQKLLSDKLDANLGYIYENIVAQMLKATGAELFYYTWPTESGKHNYEVDFILSKGSKISPIEVKSSGYKAHKSLDMFMEKYSNRIGQPYIIYTKDLQKDGPVTYIPVYMTSLL